MLPLTADVGEKVSEDGLEIQSFPFRVGREQMKGEHSPLEVNDMAFADPKPYNLSRNHFLIDKSDGGKIMVRDCRSSLGTIVNGTRIGGQAKEFTTTLSPGDNEVIAGIEHSPYRFRLVAEPAGG